jgi:hypothetical protein
MKTIALDSQKGTGAWLLTNVLEEPVLVTLPDGNRYIISHADDLETEVELLRNLELPDQSPPDWGRDIVPPDVWERWLQDERIRRERAGTLLTEPIPVSAERFTV